METMKIKSRLNSEIELTVMPGHFSSDRYHVNYYIDMTSLKTRVKSAKKIAEAIAQQYMKKVNTPGADEDFFPISFPAMVKSFPPKTAINFLIHFASFPKNLSSVL